MPTPPGGSKDQWRMKGIVGSDFFKYPCGTGAHPRALKHAARCHMRNISTNIYRNSIATPLNNLTM